MKKMGDPKHLPFMGDLHDPMASFLLRILPEGESWVGPWGQQGGERPMGGGLLLWNAAP